MEKIANTVSFLRKRIRDQGNFFEIIGYGDVFSFTDFISFPGEFNGIPLFNINLLPKYHEWRNFLGLAVMKTHQNQILVIIPMIFLNCVFGLHTKGKHWLGLEIYSVKLPGNPKLGEGKPENQNHAIIFTRGNAIQTIDMNQVRNLLEEFYCDHGVRPPTILGVREHVFTGRYGIRAITVLKEELKRCRKSLGEPVSEEFLPVKKTPVDDDDDDDINKV
ncbi:hypothetical protein DM860_016833 [Cuscuta australis]|uniref:Glycosyl transferase 48 domain-containing protein n=1 Tax=Cuscuta australis TaxID=267555 RepID=A0A328CXA9_9ASTE|nr:hypothetical protein DM860_016833 [Cuscuta australis]